MIKIYFRGRLYRAYQRSKCCFKGKKTDAPTFFYLTVAIKCYRLLEKTIEEMAGKEN